MAIQCAEAIDRHISDAEKLFSTMKRTARIVALACIIFAMMKMLSLIFPSFRPMELPQERAPSQEQLPLCP
jgi:hypothetical protein